MEKLTINAVKNEKGFIILSVNGGGLENVRLKVDDFGGKDKKKARKLTYKIYCLINGVK